MRDKRRKTPGISLSAAGRHTRLAPGHAGAGKAGTPFWRRTDRHNAPRKRRCGARFPAFCCCGWAWEERYLPLSQALTCRLGAER